ncbi:hypothetical protein [Rhizobium sp. MHM7A]|uniref:hypothetical protein n=1 Tax=Rhizobium sp. MHM7A TaxID=2583233 RepID=UPI001105C896|nr:hypothetical protein [Rhizobium sp. MHM7A]TLX16037.1 hypothetical protein FFR93_01585 [Rhizobium sp. MHM7A]
MKPIKNLVSLIKNYYRDGEARYPAARPADGIYPIEVSLRGHRFELSWSKKTQFSFTDPHSHLSYSGLSADGVFIILRDAQRKLPPETSTSAEPKTPAEPTSKDAAGRNGKAKTASSAKRTTVKNKYGPRATRSNQPTAKQLDYARAIAETLGVPLTWDGIKPTKAMVALFITYYKDRFEQKRSELREKRLEGSYVWLQTEAFKEGW